MQTYAIRAHTGPCFVKQYAEKLREAGVHVACEGTEYVYVTIAADSPVEAALGVKAALTLTHGTTLGLCWRKV